MKKIVFLTILPLITNTLFSQEVTTPLPPPPPMPQGKTNTFEIQLKGGANSTWLFNKNISDIGDSQNYAAGWGFNYGLAFNAYFGNVGFGIEGLMGNHKGAFAGKLETVDTTGTVTKTEDYKSSVNLKTISIPVMFKLKSDKGMYFEIGPQINLVSAADYKASGTTMDMDTTYTSDYASSYFSAVVGFGFKIKFGDSPLSMMTGLRLQYSFTDIKGVDALGQSLSDTFYYPKKANTSAASGGILIGLTYKLNK